jgi:hypothetical protein
VETKIKAAERDLAERRRVRALVEGMTFPAGRVEGLSAVATSGSYNDLSDTPSGGGGAEASLGLTCSQAFNVRTTPAGRTTDADRGGNLALARQPPDRGNAEFQDFRYFGNPKKLLVGLHVEHLLFQMLSCPLNLGLFHWGSSVEKGRRVVISIQEK